MFIIDIDNLDFSFESSEDKLFEGINLNLNSGEIVGLVGHNGSGKSTLIRLLIGELRASAGQVKLKSFGYLPQDVSLGDLNGTLAELYENKFRAEEWRGELALSITGLIELDLNLKLDSLSGGQRTRLGLGLILASEDIPECLVLDEPTNNLDAEGLAWLKKVLKEYKGGVLIASHERSFLDEVVDRVVAVEDKRLVSYGGSYSFYKKQLEIKQETKEKIYKESLKKRKDLETQRLQQDTNLSKYTKWESSSKRERAKNPFKVTQVFYEASRDVVETRVGKKAKAVNSKIDQLKDAERPEKDPVLDVRLNSDIASSKVVLMVKDLSKSFGQRKVLREFNLEVRGPERVLISGKNGSGKSTLLDLIAGKIKPGSGEVELGQNLNFGYFSQDVYGLDQSRTPLEELNLLENDKARCYLLCIKAGLAKQTADKKISELSRGQQAKLGFVKLMLTQPDVLVLDEPTNHLDVQTKEAIEKALEEFGGAILVASHDKYFVSRINIDRDILLK